MVIIYKVYLHCHLLCNPVIPRARDHRVTWSKRSIESGVQSNGWSTLISLVFVPRQWKSRIIHTFQFTQRQVPLAGVHREPYLFPHVLAGPATHTMLCVRLAYDAASQPSDPAGNAYDTVARSCFAVWSCVVQRSYKKRRVQSVSDEKLCKEAGAAY
jgi:hypothetical protein